MRKRLILGTAVFVVFMNVATAGRIFAEENKASISTSANFSAKASETSKEEPTETKTVTSAGDEEIKKIEEKAQETKEILKEKEKIAEAAQKEAEQIIKEKEAIEKELKSKEVAAELAKEKLEAVKKEAKTTKDPDALKEAEDLAKEAKKLEKEAETHKEKLEITESKAEKAQEKADIYQVTIETLRKELQDLRAQRSAKRSLAEKAIVSIAIIFIGLVLFFLLKLGLKEFENLITRKDRIREDEMTLRMKTLTKLFSWLGNIIIIGIVLYMVLENFGLNVAPLIAGAGIVGLAFGFGGQYLIRDLINGLFILIEGQYRIDDVVKIGEYGGLVEDINLRITTLRDLEGRVIIIPNGEIKTVVNYTREYAHALLDVGVAYKENVDQVMNLIKKVGQEMRKDPYFGRLILNELEMFGVDAFSDSAVIIKFRIKTLPIKQWEVMREFRRRLKNRFDELGIEIPFPHRTIYWGTGKENEWVKGFADSITARNAK